jgi:ABC-type Fe3+ transport system permease subunit
VSYNQPPPPPGGGYGAQQPGYGGGQSEHPQGTMILVMGILGLVCCGILAIVAWVMGNKAQKEIDAGQYAPTSGVKIGRILGMIGTILSILGLVFYLLFFVVLAANS